MRPVRLTPEFLFQINWADSGPGVSWPESYHFTPIFGYGRCVVTMSHDSPDVFGCADLAIGWFGVQERKLNGVRRIISDWWRAHGDGSAELRWSCVWKEGLVSAEEANEWADEVWNPPSPCPDCGEMCRNLHEHECPCEEWREGEEDGRSEGGAS
jgi:hypothetical protein